MKRYLLVFVFIFPAILWAGSGPDLKNLIFKAEKKSDKPFTLEFMPPKNHHFNQEAPTKVEMIDDSNKSVAQLNKSLQKVTAIFTQKNQISKTCHVMAQLYLCNDDNTYCVPVKQEYECKDLSLMRSPVSSRASAVIPANPKMEMKNFIFNDAKMAMDKARNEKKMILIDFFGIWCPPCNMLDETVFNREDFQAMQKQFVFLKMDADRPESFELKSQYQIGGYPTVILANLNGEEINRVVGARRPKAFLAEMQHALDWKSKTLNERKLLAEAGASSGEALILAQMYYNQEDFWSASKYLQLATPDKMSSIQDLNLFKKLSLGVQVGLLKELAKEASTKRKAADSLESWIKANPTLTESFEWIDYLQQLAEDIKDEPLRKRAKVLAAENARGLLKSLEKDSTLLNESELTEADLYEILAEAEEDSSPSQSKRDYLAAAASYENEIVRSGIPADRERGNNIERAYCLYKGGKDQESLNLYLNLEAVYPQEFTFYFDHASVLEKMGLFQTALEKAKQALQFSYGDNQLRAAFLVASLQVKLGQKSEAKGLLSETLEKLNVDKNLKVRTSRYVEKLQQLKDRL